MMLINGILEKWFVPHSPPLVAPEIDKWGAETMAMWLHGFAEADFTILDAIQNPLKSILDMMVDLETISMGTMVDVFTNISMGMAKALSDFEKTGILDPAIFDQLSQIGGVWGQELTLLFQRELDLAKGIKAAEEAQSGRVFKGCSSHCKELPGEGPAEIFPTAWLPEKSVLPRRCGSVRQSEHV